MSGIAGIWHRDDQPVERQHIARLVETLGHRGGDGEGCRIDGSAALGCSLARRTPESIGEVQPVVDADGTMLVFDGRLDNRDELRAALPRDAATSDDSPDSSFALAAYRAFHLDFAARLAGDFALGLYDPRRRHVVLARDPIGVRPLYYYASRDLFVFASEMKGLLADERVETQPNDDLLADFLLTRLAARPPLEETFLQNVRAVLPGHRVVILRDGERSQMYWDFDAARELRLARESDYADAFRERLEIAVRRRLRNRSAVAVWVSGGVDSSAIFCLAAREQAAVRGISLVFPDGAPADEKRFLDPIEEATGASILRIAHANGGVMNGCGEGIWHAESPFLDAQWNGTRADLLTTRALGATVLLTGHWGDQVLCDEAYLVDLCRRGAWRRAWRHLHEASRWTGRPVRDHARRVIESLFRDVMPRAIVSAARTARAAVRAQRPGRACFTDAFLARADRWRRRAPVFPTKGSAHARSVYRAARSAYHVLCMEWNNKVAAMHGLDMAFPFLDRDLIAFLMAIPGDVQSRNGVPKALLRDALCDVLPAPIAARASKADFTRVVNDGVADEYAQIAERTRRTRHAVDRGYVRADALSALGTGGGDRTAPTCEQAWALVDLLALELWLEAFAARRPQHVET